jgi:prepilin-type N-terminal cleavage/methylation domain-containing protein
MHRGTLRTANWRTLRRGLTLIEIILVLAILVVIGAIAIPTLQGSFTRASLHSSGDLLRGAFAKARLSAMQSGDTHAFRYELYGSRFQIAPLGAMALPENNQLVPVAEEDAPEDKVLVSLTDNRLPNGIVFAGGNVSSSNQIMALQPDSGEGPWSPPILFRPDGTTSDASLLLSTDKQVMIRVTLRGLTGVASIVDVEGEVTP